MDRAIVKQGFITSFDKSDIILPYIQDDFNKIKNDVDVPAGTTSNALNRAKCKNEDCDDKKSVTFDNVKVARQILGAGYNGGVGAILQAIEQQGEKDKKDFFNWNKVPEKDGNAKLYSREAGFADVSRVKDKNGIRRCPKW